MALLSYVEERSKKRKPTCYVIPWDIAGRQPMGSPLLSLHDSPMQIMALSPNGETLAPGSWDNAVKLWDISKLR